MDKLLNEYLECSNNMRHYGNHQAALITAYIAINGAVAALIFSTTPKLDFFEDIGAKNTCNRAKHIICY